MPGGSLLSGGGSLCFNILQPVGLVIQGKRSKPTHQRPNPHREVHQVSEVLRHLEVLLLTIAGGFSRVSHGFLSHERDVPKLSARNVHPGIARKHPKKARFQEIVTLAAGDLLNRCRSTALNDLGRPGPQTIHAWNSSYTLLYIITPFIISITPMYK